MKQIKLSCGCKIKIQAPQDSQLMKQLFPFFPWVPSNFHCTECGLAVFMEVIENEKEKK